ncbi:carbamate kinase [Breznakia sp. PF5-3]|uniref:carbamate kinase n=1 Tax=unclassified Breznakia TaxID=2623764 RepID=UPI0024076D5F|nr:MULTISPECIES: carbamate kinase [unclassified Breznakia]MDF9824609.1 carbamate kinase [Breznakia sp. PM6-1]MDF9835545.1 carbamate kinase [Breznakia sp. PF5-3]MDF9837953.1 carbamate kinase [Breznakia sp. PFB2-8]MDF9859942.1 carbamate kinase [Breznakia sp. PH5-24]
MSRIVIALGGNALGNTPEEQLEKIDQATKSLVGLITQGNEIIISHGNGPQVGMIKLALDMAHEESDKIAQFELPECTAMSQGYIGYHLQQGIMKEIHRLGLPWHCASVVTQMEVDEQDPAFSNPTKPIGAFYSKEDAEAMMKKDPSLVFKEDAGRGYRQMVASPKPLDIVEKDSILNLLDNEFIVIACGGGGIPVIKDENGDHHGIPAVIDKDFASAKLAELVDADYLFVLTAVDRVMVNFGKPDQKEIIEMSIEEAKQYIEEGHFAPGSMLPKVEAAMQFAESKAGRKSIIASLEKAPLAMKGESGTLIKL